MGWNRLYHYLSLGGSIWYKIKKGENGWLVRWKMDWKLIYLFMGVSHYTCVWFMRLGKTFKKLFGLRRILGYRRFLAALKWEFFDLRRVIQLYTTFGRVQAKFSYNAILYLHGAFRNVTLRKTENALYLFIYLFFIFANSMHISKV